MQLEFTLRETTLVEDEMHNCEHLTERIKECQPYIEEVLRSLRCRSRCMPNHIRQKLGFRGWY